MTRIIIRTKQITANKPAPPYKIILSNSKTGGSVEMAGVQDEVVSGGVDGVEVGGVEVGSVELAGVEDEVVSDGVDGVDVVSGGVDGVEVSI